MIDYVSAEDEIFGIANTAFVVASQAQESLAYAPKLIFPGMLEKPDPTEINAECSFSVVTDHQVGLANVQSKSLYEAVGLFVMQIYSAKNQRGDYRIAKLIADAVRNSFYAPSPSGKIWFRDQKVTPVGGNQSSNQVNVVITCSFKTEK